MHSTRRPDFEAERIRDGTDGVEHFADAVRGAPDIVAWAHEQSGWRLVARDASTVAKQLLEDTEFVEIDLANVLQGPDGKLIQTVVSWILPDPASAEFKLLVDAVTIAARAKQRNQ